MLRYRADIDGLRALAIIPVIVYHLGFPWLPGGFVGVDVFFVISGYLITGILVREIDAGQFSLARFYLRRARRILPALFVVLGASLLGGLLILTPTELQNFGKTMAGAAGFISNVLFFRETGYFDIAAERKPLLMTWSLGIEEQFYIAWPLTLLVLSKRRSLMPAGVAGIAAVSFFIATREVAGGSSAAFYLLPGRAWELLLGASLALRGEFLSLPSRRSFVSHAASIAGLGLIIASCLGLDRGSPFPGWNAVPACLGTLLVIWAGEDAIGNRLILSSRPLVLIGLISYPLYLWHWPLKSFAHIVTGPDLPSSLAVSLAVCALLLSILTWRFIEKPLRSASATAPAPALARFGLLTAIFVVVGSLTYFGKGFPGRVPDEFLRADAARRDIDPHAATCLLELSSMASVELPTTACAWGSAGPPTMALWGDSHAGTLAAGLGPSAVRNARGLIQLTATNCPPLPGVHVIAGYRRLPGCAEFNEQVSDFLLSRTEIKTVFLTARWAVYTEPSEGRGPAYRLTDAPEGEPSGQDSRAVLERRLRQIVARLTASGKRVVLIGSIPEMGRNIPECIQRRIWLGRLAIATDACSVPAEAVKQRLTFSTATLSAIADGSDAVFAAFPAELLCSSADCESAAGEQILYLDSDHLSASGARYIVEHLGLDSVGPS